MVDLRSDTISMPTREMLGTILEAKLGDDGRTDSRGRGEDLAVDDRKRGGCIVPVRNTGQYVRHSGLLQAWTEGDGR